MSDEQPGYRHERWSHHFEEIDQEIVKYATICQIRLLDPGVIERVLKNDRLVCGHDNPAAFDKLRALLTMHYTVRDRSQGALGEQETQEILEAIVARLRARVGDKLGGSPAA